MTRDTFAPRSSTTKDNIEALHRLDRWLTSVVGEDADPVHRAQYIKGHSTMGIVLGVPEADRDFVAPFVYEWRQDVLDRAAEFEEMTRPRARYIFRAEDLDPRVRMRLHTARSVIEFEEDKDSGLFLAVERKVVGGPFRRDELPHYDKALL
jgi:hypothetical protein